MHYGFIGLGNLGGQLAVRLLDAGFQLTVFDLDKTAMETLVSAGANPAEGCADLAQRVEHVITCLPSPPASSAVQDDILSHMTAGATLIEMSTVGQDDVIRSAARAEAQGIGFLELPVTGGVHLAARGELTLLAGGSETLIALHEPAMKAMGKKVFHMGAVGTASLIKVITNMLAFVHLAAGGEAMMLAARGGLDLATAWQAIAASSGNSFVHETEGQLILNGSYDIGFTLDLALKDLEFAEQFGAAFDVPLPLAKTAQERFKTAQARYGGDAQSPFVVKLLEDELDTALRAPGFPDKLT
ncbi:MAG: NAD(P)-dependent oxidoreductase [Luminiphilus sp.]|nr:NAD(P)-dependent oxidoreductase [Luminiphilus sp.]